MILGISPMGNTVQFIFYGVGIALFVLATIGQTIMGAKWALGWLGLAAVFFPVFWDRLAAL